MAQQTAVEWLIEQLRLLSFNPKTHLGMGDIRVTQGLLDDLLEQSKEMEKQQIVKAVNVGFDEGCKFPEDIKLGSGEQYYTQTYGK
jgi:hypothetical protein